MHSRLAQILAEKCKEVDRLKKGGVPRNRDNDVPPIRDFKGAISRSDRINLIAEIKFASPSAGIIREKSNPITIGQIYEDAGAAAISLLTDKTFFRGDSDHLPRLKESISLPILRKDFIIDEIQVRESFLLGADAVLLIVRLLSQQQLKELLGICHDHGMEALIEVHDRQDLNVAIRCGAEIIGINNRDLDTLEVNIETTLELAPLVPDGHIVVSESGVKNRGDLQLLKQAGIHAVLVGTVLMKSGDIGKKAREFILAGAI
ncbi:MAG: indole-3-glycerol phosphate synthase TrpC [Deltaproteobacteria bacterium]|nr:indole-3-glycerol phosphate synthase TrpC [Deltaproteobacteria bacterium]